MQIGHLWKLTWEKSTLGFRFVLLPDWLFRNSVLLDVTTLPNEHTSKNTLITSKIHRNKNKSIFWNSQILRTIFRNRWILIRRSDRIQLMNVAQVRIVSVCRHRALFLELLHVPIVLLHDRIVTVILLRHVLLLQLVLMMHGRIAIHDS